MMPHDHRDFRARDRVDLIAHKSAKYKRDNTIVSVNVFGRSGTITGVTDAEAGFKLYRIAVDICDDEIIAVQALARGVLEVYLTRQGFVLLMHEKNGASGEWGFLYRRPLRDYAKYRLAYGGSILSAWDPVREQYEKTLEDRCTTDLPLLAALCGEFRVHACTACMNWYNVNVLLRPFAQGKYSTQNCPYCVWRSQPITA